MLRRLAWSSVLSPSFSPARLNEIIAPARRHNERNHISGMLLFTGTHFLGIFEGDDLDLGKLWLRLASDKRHCELFRIGDELCGKRWFPEWLMAYTHDPDVGVQIESLRLLQMRVCMNQPDVGVDLQTRSSLQVQGVPAWARVIHPIMLRADSM
jgi:hypothetical protein